MDTMHSTRSSNAADQELPGMVGRHPLMVAAYRQVRAVAPSDDYVTIVGETGTGKELVARALHDLSPRRRQLFFAVNAATLTVTLFESELFGHERWAFSDAKTAKPGLLEAAHGSTFYLDELGSLPSPRQAKLLRVIEEKEARRVGGVTPRPAAPRWVVSCQAISPRSGIGHGVRPDLWYRVSEVILILPPLRQRVDDIPLLVAHFLCQRGYPADWFEAGALELLMGAPWRGNVRELQRVVGRLLATHNGHRIAPVAVSEALALGRPEEGQRGVAHRQAERHSDPAEGERLFTKNGTQGPAREDPLDPERLRVLTIGRDLGWDWRLMAAALGRRRSAFYEHLHRLGISLRHLRRETSRFSGSSGGIPAENPEN